MSHTTELALLVVVNLVLAVFGALNAGARWQTGKRGAAAWYAILAAGNLGAASLCAYGLWSAA